jgi:hypothetical protein
MMLDFEGGGGSTSFKPLSRPLSSSRKHNDTEPTARYYSENPVNQVIPEAPATTRDRVIPQWEILYKMEVEKRKLREQRRNELSL